MPDKLHHADRSLKRRAVSATAFTAAFAAFLGFGVILLIAGDWIPGGIIATAGVVGLFVTFRVIGRLCRESPAGPHISSRPAS
jgi:uncharacterized membrane protein YjjP (DUF1212 family)